MIDVTTNDREVITYTETFDDEAFRVTAQIGGASAFGFDAAKKDGWDVRGVAGPNEHTFIFKRSFSRQGAEAGLTRLNSESMQDTPDDAFLIGPTAFVGLPITASAANQTASVPALLRPWETQTKNGRQDPAFQLANARVNASAVDTVVRVHIELRDSTGVHRIEPSFAETTAPTAGLRIGHPWPLSRILTFWREVGPYGVFDYEHHSPPLCSADPNYHKAWMFGVGVYANGARIPQQLLSTAATLASEWLAKHPVKCP